MTEQERKIADLQRLCERAYYVLSENHCTDKDGYGPSSLLRDLKKAMNGQEQRDLRRMNDLLARRIKELENTLAFNSGAYRAQN